MNVTIDQSWRAQLQEEFAKAYFSELTDFVTSEYKNYICFPPQHQIFEAFNQCSFQDVKVVVIGQDPYHGIGQAHGLCFSVNETVAIPPSLINVFKELESDLSKPYPNTGNLSHWAKQGVLLLNATLTVRAHIAGSHQGKGWEDFTDAVIKIISQNRKDVVFLLWGGFAKKKSKLIDARKHLVLTSGHPSPLSANRGYWFGNKHFSKANAYLVSKGFKAVDW